MDLVKLPIKFFLKPFTFAYYANIHLRKWLLKYHPDNIQESYEDSDDMFIKTSYYRGTWIQVNLFRKFYIRVQVRTTARHSVLKKKSSFMTLWYAFVAILINSFWYLEYAPHRLNQLQPKPLNFIQIYLELWRITVKPVHREHAT